MTGRFHGAPPPVDLARELTVGHFVRDLIRDGEAQSIVFQGESGTGKSVLAERAVAFVGAFRALVLESGDSLVRPGTSAIWSDLGLCLSRQAVRWTAEARAEHLRSEQWTDGHAEDKKLEGKGENIKEVGKEEVQGQESEEEKKEEEEEGFVDRAPSLSGLETRMMYALRALRAFVEAATPNNGTASRAGVLVRMVLASRALRVEGESEGKEGSGVFVSSATEKILPGTLVGASLELSPLDVGRVTHVPPGERNFSALYALVVGAPSAWRPRLRLPSAANVTRLLARGGATTTREVLAASRGLDPDAADGLRALPDASLRRGSTMSAAGSVAGSLLGGEAGHLEAEGPPELGDCDRSSEDDAAVFRATEEALVRAGVPDSERLRAWRTLAAVLALGDVGFAPRQEGGVGVWTALRALSGAPGTASPPPSGAPGSRAAQWSAQRFADAAFLLQADPQSLALALSHKRRADGGWDPLGMPSAAEERRDRLARSLYSAAVGGVLQALCRALRADTPRVRAALRAAEDAAQVEVRLGVFGVKGHLAAADHEAQGGTGCVFLRLKLRRRTRRRRTGWLRWTAWLRRRLWSRSSRLVRLRWGQLLGRTRTARLGQCVQWGARGGRPSLSVLRRSLRPAELALPASRTGGLQTCLCL
jgi:hypothetical protein